jgi:hypothetical protein
VASLASRISSSLPSSLAILSLPVCANRSCLRPPTLWQRWWARHEGIHLEDGWYCSPECFAAGLGPRVAALGRADGRTQTPHQRFPLGLILLEQGVISQPVLQEALRLQREAGQGRIGEWLVRLGAATEAEIMGALAVQQNCPIFSGSAQQDFSAFQFPALLIRSHGGVPVYFNPAANCLYLGFAGPLNRPLLRAAEYLLRCRLEPCIVSQGLHRAVAKHWEGSLRGEAICIEQRQSAREMTRAIASYAEQAKASGCALARCEQYLWTRLYGDIASLDLLFRLSPAEVPETQPDEPKTLFLD